MTKPDEFIINEVLGTFIQQNVEDIDKNRTGNRFVFPEFAKKDINLPQITVQIGEPSFENIASGDYLEEVEMDNGDYYVTRYKKGVYPVTIYALTVKDKEYEISIDNNPAYLSNKMICNYWIYQVLDTLRTKRKYLLEHFDDVQITGIPVSYEANSTRWVSELSIQIHIKSIWQEKYANGELIASYTLSETVMED